MTVNHRGLYPLLCAGLLLIAPALPVQAASVSLLFTNSPSATVTNGTLVPVNVIVATSGAPVLVSVTLNFQTLAPLCTNLWNGLAMATNASATNFVATIPRLPASNVNYYASCVWTDGGTTYTNVTSTNTYTVSATLDTTRNQTFEGGNWSPAGITPPDYNALSSDGWTGTMVRVGTTNALLGRLGWNGSTNCALLRNGTNSQGQLGFFQSPLLPEGANTLYFEAAMRTISPSWTNSFKAQFSTNNGALWTDLQSFTLTGTTILYAAVSVNTRVPSYVRLQRTNNMTNDSTSLSAGVLDNIRVSLPPADLNLSVPTNAVSPLYPQNLEPVTFLCNVQDVSTNEPTINQRVTLFYTWVSTNGATTNIASLSMTNVPGTPGQYAAVAALGAGTNQYYYRFDFDGYYYTNSDKRGPYYLSAGGQTSTNTIPANKFTYVINYQNTRVLRLQPATDLSFGLCATNDSRSRTLFIYNDGNTPLTVTNLMFGGAGFSTSFTTNLVVPVNGPVSVSVTFAPAMQVPYSDTLTVYSDMTAGTNTYAVAGQGMPVEALSQPTVAATGATAGTLGQTLGFFLPVVATDTWGYVVQHHFDWGDGSTSAWDTATATNHAWSTNGVFYVCAQGRSLTNNSTLSILSDPVSVTITNTRIMGLSGSLDFGTLGVNAQPLPLQLTITNSGNGSLNVANITSADPSFSISPTAFDIPASNAMFVTVTYAPTNIMTSATSLITVVSANMTSGINTTNATGAAEQLTVWGLTPTNAAGTLGQTLAFTAWGADSSGHGLNYRFNWGNNTTSAWTTASASTYWPTAGVFTVSAQAQCQTNLNVVSAWYGSSLVTITNTRILGLSGSLDFGIVVTNYTSNLFLTVTNSGNGSLSVTNITFLNSAFSVTNSSFVLATNSATNVMVRFVPTAPGYYTSTLVVASDATSGTTNAVSVVGACEMVGKPTLAAPVAADAVTHAITFTAQATNNVGDSMNYRFDWGDSSTSDWASATNVAHSWATTNIFSIRAQAQAQAPRTNALSVWSDAFLLTITNSRVMVLSPTNLVFGGLMTNQTAISTLTVSNSGTGPFSVTNIICPLGFSVFPTNFVVQPTNSVLVTNTFAPQALGAYTGMVTVLSQDVANGGGSVSVTGFCEMVYTPVMTSVLAGHVNDALPFSASASNNASGHAIQYRFDWGDNTTSGWTTAATTSHGWGATNAYRVRVQASCTNDTNVVSVWSTTNTVNIYAAPFFTFATITNGRPFQVMMTATGAVPGNASNCVFYFVPPGSTNAQPLSLAYASGNNWTNTIPPLNPGSMQYYMTYQRADMLLRYPAAAASNITFSITNYLGTGQQLGFDVSEGWAQTGPAADNDWGGPSGWTGTMMKVAGQSALRSPAINNTLRAMWLRNGTNSLGQLAYVMSPLLPSGVGSIYFEIAMSTLGWSSGFSVLVSTNNGATWDTCYSNAVADSTILYPVVPLNIRAPTLVRIQRTTNNLGDNSNGGGNSALVIDNLIISPPPTDVRLTESLHNPGYPNSKDPTRVRCQVSDYDPINAPSENRRLSVVYQYAGAATWITNSMSNVVINGSSLYEGTIQAYSPVYDSLNKVSPAVSYYFTCTFDGYYYSNSIITNATIPYPSENLSPAYNPDQRTPGPGPGQIQALTLYQYPNHYPVPSPNTPPAVTNVIPVYAIYPYRQDDGSMVIQSTPPFAAPQNVMTLVDDNIWRGQVQVSGITNPAWFFVGSAHYSNNATALGDTSSWGGGTNQDNIHPPLGGSAVLSTNDPLVASFVYGGSMIFQYNTSNHTYLVKRAVYQDFDHPLWPASPNYFQDSWSLFSITTFNNNFSGWGTNYFQRSATWKTEDFQDDSVNGPLTSSELPTINNWWQYQDAVTTNERAFTDSRYAINNAMQLNNASGAMGSIFNFPPNGFTEGINNFTFRARLAQNDGRPALYTLGLSQLTNGSPWTIGYHITNTISVSSMSPAFPSVSLLFCYQPGSSWPNYNYYELRLSQVADASAIDSKLQLDLFRWNNGVITKEIAGFPKSATTQKLTGTPLLADFSWTNVAGLGVVFTGSVSRAGATLFAWPTNTVDADANYITGGGTVGFLCSDTDAQIGALGISAGTNLDAGMLTLQPFTPANWYLGQTTLPASLPACWANVSGTLSRPIPGLANAPQLSLTVNRTGTAKSSSTPLRAYWTNCDSYAVTSFAYTTFSHAFQIWDKAFLSLQYANGNLPVVVDDLAIDPWRAYTRGVADSDWTHKAEDANNVLFWDWTDTAQQFDWSQNGKSTPSGPIDPTSWLIFEGLIENSGDSAGNYVSFNQSRANPALDQGLWSPLLTNGIGSLTFQASVGNGTSVYAVAIAITTPGLATQWHTQQIFTNTAVDGWVNRSVYLGHVKAQANETGRIRLVQLPVSYGTSPGAVLKIDNLVALDNPPTDATSWHAYNCLIVAANQNTNMTPHALDAQTCYLNNNPTNDVLSPLQYIADNSYIQSPKVDTGIGEIGFDYRAWDATPVYVSVQVAPSAATPAGQWTVITNFTVTTTNRQHFAMDPFDAVDKVMRIYVTNAIPVTTTGRLCIDNILLTEPVRAGYEITSVQLLPGQPLMTDTVGVQATIGNPLMNPQGIHVFLSYVVSSNAAACSNAWGLNQWWGTGNSPTAGVTTIELTNTTGKTYATSGKALIPANLIDSVVQYVVWGTNADMVGPPYFQGTNSFNNPSWYYPVDLNPKDGTGAYQAPANWSPYYFVYSCPPGSVWVNEINYPYYQPDYDIGSYVELVGPANAHLGKWTIDLLDSNPSLVDSLAISNNFVLTNVSNGWGFFVWGDASVSKVNRTFNGSPNSMPVPGAIRLIRSMGAWEDRVSWAMDLDGYVNAGFKNWFIYGAPLAMVGGPGSNNLGFAWSQPSSDNYTPGLPNTDQILTNAPVIPDSLFYTVTSLIGTSGGQQNGVTNVLLTMQVAQNGTTQIVYTAASWFRIRSLLTNGVSAQQASNQVTYTWMASNITQNISNNVNFSMLSTNTNNVPTSWLAGFGQSESTPFDHDPFSVYQEWLLNMNPYVSNAVSFGVDAIGVTGSAVNVAIKLLERTNGVSFGAQQSIYGTLYLQGSTNLGGAWTPVASTQVAPPGLLFDANGRKVFSLPASTNKFYRALVQ